MKSIVTKSIVFLPLLLATSALRNIVTKMSSNRQLVLDAFGLRQFNNPDYTGTQVKYNEIEFEKKVNEYYTQGVELQDGYAPFCKHLFIPNFVGPSLQCGYTEINSENKHLIESCYEAR